MIRQAVFLHAALACWAALSSGCTHQQLYDSTTELRAQDCRHLSDRERYDCEQSARNLSYKEYLEAREAAAKN